MFSRKNRQKAAAIDENGDAGGAGQSSGRQYCLKIIQLRMGPVSRTFPILCRGFEIGIRIPLSFLP